MSWSMTSVKLQLTYNYYYTTTCTTTHDDETDGYNDGQGRFA